MALEKIEKSMQRFLDRGSISYKDNGFEPRYHIAF
jgi:hypothetical protein